MEFLVEFEVNIPKGTSEVEREERESAEAAAAAGLAEQGHLIRVWKLPLPDGAARTVGLYRAGDRAELDRLLEALPLYEWMHVSVSALEPHPNDPGAWPAAASGERGRR